MGSTTLTDTDVVSIARDIFEVYISRQFALPSSSVAARPDGLYVRNVRALGWSDFPTTRQPKGPDGWDNLTELLFDRMWDAAETLGPNVHDVSYLPEGVEP